MAEAGEETERGVGRSFMPPYRVLRDFLPRETVADLLAFAERRQAKFRPNVVGNSPIPDVSLRVSTGLRGLAEFQPLLRTRLLELAPSLVTELRMSPFEISEVELQLVAHGDGAFFKRHIDTTTDSPTEHTRVLSGVYYFHRHPKAFTGGALRLYAIGDNTRFVDIEPAHNTLLAFPSWGPHEVMPVQVPSGRFADSRFAINCWFRQRRSL
jgi:SM-20-related protein